MSMPALVPCGIHLLYPLYWPPLAAAAGRARPDCRLHLYCRVSAGAVCVQQGPVIRRWRPRVRLEIPQREVGCAGCGHEAEGAQQRSPRHDRRHRHVLPGKHPLPFRRPHADAHPLPFRRPMVYPPAA
eukprot:scaffold6174_cov125-Isochrysis_galbana.AAC.6